MAKTLSVEISNYISIQREQLTPTCEADLLSYLTYRNPELALKKKLGIWAGNVPPAIKTYRYSDDGRILIDRGSWRIVQNIASRYGLTIKITDRRTSNTVAMPVMDVVLEAYQKAALDNILNVKHQGIVVFPTGTGKTITALFLASKLNEKTIVLVHTHELLNQWMSVIKRLLPGADVKYYSGLGKEIGNHFTIATVQSVMSINDPKFFSQFGAVIADEMHHYSADTFQTAIGNFPSKYRYGFTATPKRRDGKTFLLHSIFGDILAEIDYEDAGERIILPTIYPVVFEDNIANYKDAYVYRGGELRLDHTKLFNMLAEDSKRNSRIAQLVKSLVDEGDNYILLLSKRREHAKDLTDHFNQSGIITESLLGGGGAKYKKYKEDVLKRASNGQIPLLIGTSVADEGLDICILNTLILAFPGSWYGTLQQRIGRIVRNHKGKRKPRVFDIVDTAIPECVNAWKARKSFFIRSGMEIDYSLCPEKIHL